MIIAERADKTSDVTQQLPAIVAIVGGIEYTAHRIAARLTRLVPTDWQCRQMSNFDQVLDQTRNHDSEAITLIVLTCRDDDGLDTAGLMQRVEQAGSTPLVVAGSDSQLPPPEACVRADVAARIDIEETEDLIDARLSRAIERAGRQRRLEALERINGAARARIDGSIVTGATPSFAELIGADTAQSLDGASFEEWLNPGDVSRLSAARAQLAENNSESGCGLILRRSEAGSIRALSAHLHLGADRGQWLSLAPLDATSVPLLGWAPIADARMSLHHHLASIHHRAETGRLRGLILVAVDAVPALQQQLGLARTDELLEDVGLYLIDQLSDADRCFRFTVGEYVLSVERSAAAEVTEIARGLVRAVGDTEFDGRQASAHVTVSVSAVMLGAEPGSNDRRLAQLAETITAVREAGGDAYQACEDDPIENAEPSTEAWQAQLQQALATDRFRLAFQTVTSLAGDHRRYYDVLLRYFDERDGLVLPADFLPAAEAAGLMCDIDRWVARRAAQVVADQAKRSMEVALFVKLSTATLDNGQAFAEWLDTDAGIQGIDRQQLIFCVRESDARAHVAATRWLAGTLDRAGFRFALTHFGQDNSHAAMLDNMVLSFIKLAPAFARQLAEQNTEDEHLQQIIDYARRYQVPLIAEHIEDAASMARLWQAGVNYVQGHFIQEPDTAAIQSGADAG